MRFDDGRVVTNFVQQALAGTPLTVYGDGSQTRSFCYVDDEVSGLLALVDGPLTGPVNIGNPHEVTMLELARSIIELTGSSSTIEHRPLPADDPRVRRPDTELASSVLGWAPTVTLRDGLTRMIDDHRNRTS
jgi:UDP-glucuronate decarboxylase